MGTQADRCVVTSLCEGVVPESGGIASDKTTPLAVEVVRSLLVIVIFASGLVVVAASALILVIIVLSGLVVVTAATLVLGGVVIFGGGLVVVATAAKEHGALVVEGSVNGHCDCWLEDRKRRNARWCVAEVEREDVYGLLCKLLLSW